MKLDVSSLARLCEPDTPWPYLDFVPKPQKPGGGFELVRLSEIELRPPTYLIEGVLEAEALGMIFGPSGSCKSFLAIDMAASVAAGAAWHKRATRQGAVVYIAGEGQSGIARRFKAWAAARSVSLARAPVFISRLPPRLTEADSVKAVREAVERVVDEAGEIALVIIDTVNRCFGAGDENSTSDMTRFVDAMAAIRDEFSATVLAVHHAGKDASQGARGSSVLRAAMDFEAGVSRDRAGRVRFGITKMKEAPIPDSPLWFQLVAEPGEAGGSAALEELDEAPGDPGPEAAPEEKLSKGASAVLRAFEKAARKMPEGDGRVDLETWRKCFYEASPLEPAAKKKAFTRGREELVERGRLAVKDDFYTYANPIIAHFMHEAIALERERARARGEAVPGDPEAQGEAVAAPEPLQGHKTASDSDPAHEPSEARGDPEAAAQGEPLLEGDPEAEAALEAFNRKVQQLRDGFTSS